MKLTPLEKLMKTHPGLEIWWDSSPLIYSSWMEGILKKAASGKVEEIREQLKRFFDPEQPGKTLFRGVTTNPPLSLGVIKARESYVAEIIDGLIEQNPGIDRESLFWMTYKEIVRRGAEMYLEVFKQSGYRYGYLSGQVDPRNLTDLEKMKSQALELASLSPNVMIKVPGSKQGYEVIRFLTSKGISTNNTLTFVLPQLMACAKAVKEGLEIAKKNGVDLTRWRSVITHMTARYGDLGDLRKEAETLKINLSEADIRWAEIAIFKKAYRLLKERNYPSKMLICSMRISPEIDGKKHCWHLEKLAGGDIVFTCPPSFIEATFEFLDGVEFRPQIDEEVPKPVLDKLFRLPYFERAYQEDGYSYEEFNTHPVTIATASEFSKATEGMVEFVAKRLALRRK
ncbi:MAG: transaldolase [Deltaproteobacteria bacterium]|nr:transaldolase [Deltaproteobacteria bacterium]MBM4323538.1 transaldolase [Deltaproteobacteria bacterium]MBM4348100.1 transaldolase [Deltaproteobacteria bacterium]